MTSLWPSLKLCLLQDNILLPRTEEVEYKGIEFGAMWGHRTQSKMKTREHSLLAKSLETRDAKREWYQHM